MDEPSKPYVADAIVTPKQSERGVEMISFQRSEKNQKKDEVETIAFTRSNKPVDDFVLYTEEEYKQMNK